MRPTLPAPPCGHTPFRAAYDPCRGPPGGGAGYAPRDPESTLLHAVLRERLEPVLARLRAEGRPLPGFVEAELRAFLGCGVLARGFRRLRCDGCGAPRLVAFSCAGRGFCPGCGGRRMNERAANLVEHVIPFAPVRQWVLSLPWSLRLLAAYDHEVRLDLHRALTGALSAWQRRRARAAGIADPRTGSVAVVQRFGSDLSVNPHVHLLTFDGVFHRPGGPGRPVRFRHLPPPTDDDVCDVVEAVAARAARALARRGVDLHDRDRMHAAAADLLEEEPALASLAGAAVQGRLAFGPAAGCRPARLGPDGPPDDGQDHDPDPPDEPPPRARRRSRLCAEADGFNLHAGVVIPQWARDRLERLCRYLLRPPISDDRLSMADDDTVAVRLKSPWSDGSTHVLLPRDELVARLAALVPPPFANTILYAGVLAGHSAWRAEVIPGETPLDRRRRRPGVPPTHRCRRIPWDELVRRAFGVGADPVRCPCGGTFRPVADITDRAVVRRILLWLGMRPDPLPITQARPPPADPDDAWDACDGPWTCDVDA